MNSCCRLHTGNLIDTTWLRNQLLYSTTVCYESRELFEKLTFLQITEGSPYAQKIRLLLDAAGIPFKRCDQPPVLPRPDLKELGITYRRIPVVSIGKDVYCDTSCIINAIQSQFPTRALPTSPADEAYNAFGSRTFQNALFMIPNLKQVGQYFLKDREGIFRECDNLHCPFELESPPSFENTWLISNIAALKRPDFAEHRSSALAAYKTVLDIVENEFLDDRAWIWGDKISLADVHVAWVIRWGLEGMGVGKEEGFGATSFPKTYKWYVQDYDGAYTPEYILTEVGEGLHNFPKMNTILWRDRKLERLCLRETMFHQKSQLKTPIHWAWPKAQWFRLRQSSKVAFVAIPSTT